MGTLASQLATTLAVILYHTSREDNRIYLRTGKYVSGLNRLSRHGVSYDRWSTVDQTGSIRNSDISEEFMLWAPRQERMSNEARLPRLSDIIGFRLEYSLLLRPRIPVNIHLALRRRSWALVLK